MQRNMTFMRQVTLTLTLEDERDELVLDSFLVQNPKLRPEVSGTARGALPDWLERRLEESEEDYQAGRFLEWEEVKRASDLKYGHL